MRVAGPLSFLWDDWFVAGRSVSTEAMWEVEQAMGWLAALFLPRWHPSRGGG